MTPSAPRLRLLALLSDPHDGISCLNLRLDHCQKAVDDAESGKRTQECGHGANERHQSHARVDFERLENADKQHKAEEHADDGSDDGDDANDICETRLAGTAIGPKSSSWQQRLPVEATTAASSASQASMVRLSLWNEIPRVVP